MRKERRHGCCYLKGFSKYLSPFKPVCEPHTIHNSLIRSDEGLTLETSASQSLYGGQFTLSTQLIKPNCLVILSPTQHHSFFRNLPPAYMYATQNGVHLSSLYRVSYSASYTISLLTPLIILKLTLLTLLQQQDYRATLSHNPLG